MLKKGIIIFVVSVLLIIVVDTCLYLRANYNEYNNYIEKFKNYGYENSDFYVPNNFVRKDTISYMEYEYNKVVKETKDVIETYGQKYDLSYNEHKLPIDRINYLKQYLTDQLNDKLNGIEITKDSNDSEKEEKEKLQSRIETLNSTSSKELTIEEKDKLLDEVKELEIDVKAFNEKVAARIKKEEEEKKKEKAERLAAQAATNNYSSSSSYSSSNSYSSSGSSSSSGPWWKTHLDSDLRMCMQDQLAVVAITARNAEAGIGGQYADLGAENVRSSGYITLACGMSLDPTFDNTPLYWGSFHVVDNNDGTQDFYQLPIK